MDTVGLQCITVFTDLALRDNNARTEFMFTSYTAFANC